MQPTVFISHGAPSTALDDNDYTRALHRFAQNLEQQPKGILVMSAHGMSSSHTTWLSSPQSAELAYDFSGFSKELYSITYPYKPFSTSQLTQVVNALKSAAVSLEHRAFDHGVWTPLLHMFPDANVPIAQISMPYPSSPQSIFDLGKSLRVMREEGVLILGSGGAVHNLRMVQWPGEDALDDNDWALEFNDWLVDKVTRKQMDDLLYYETKAPSPRMAHPHPDHLLPMFFTLGASFESDQAHTLINTFQMSTLSMFSFAMT